MRSQLLHKVVDLAQYAVPKEPVKLQAGGLTIIVKDFNDRIDDVQALILDDTLPSGLKGFMRIMRIIAPSQIIARFSVEANTPFIKTNLSSFSYEMALEPRKFFANPVAILKLIN